MVKQLFVRTQCVGMVLEDVLVAVVAQRIMSWCASMDFVIRSTRH